MVGPNRGRFQVKRFLLDSNAVNALMRRQENVLANYTHARRSGFRVGTCEPIVAEILAGLEMSSTRAANLDRFQRTLNEIACWPLDRAASQAFGKIAAELRRIGRPMQTIDIMLAATLSSVSEIRPRPFSVHTSASRPSASSARTNPSLAMISPT